MEWLWDDSLLSMAQMHDKWAHAGGCALWMCTLWLIIQGCRALCRCSYWQLPPRTRKLTMKHDLRWCIGIVFAVGVLLEVWQQVISPLDVLANGIGIAVAAWAIRVERRLL